jgi:anthranilate phosphoribosyltransferase
VTWIAELKDGKVTTSELKPEDVGLRRGEIADLKGGDAAHNADALRGVLAGQKGAFRDAAVMTAGSALLVADKVSELKDGIEVANRAVTDGKAHVALERLIAVSNS